MGVEFTPEQQEFFNNTLAEKQKQWTRKYENYASPDDVKNIRNDYDKQIVALTAELDAANKKISAHDKEIAERDDKIKGFELANTKTRIAREVGLSVDASEFLKGNDEATIKASAEALKNLMGSSGRAPSFVPIEKVESEEDKKKAHYAELAKSLNLK